VDRCFEALPIWRSGGWHRREVGASSFGGFFGGESIIIYEKYFVLANFNSCRLLIKALA
jgi:hypothetical protein